jgi:hypothetical protein
LGGGWLFCRKAGQRVSSAAILGESDDGVDAFVRLFQPLHAASIFLDLAQDVVPDAGALTTKAKDELLKAIASHEGGSLLIVIEGFGSLAGTNITAVNVLMRLLDQRPSVDVAGEAGPEVLSLDAFSTLVVLVPVKFPFSAASSHNARELLLEVSVERTLFSCGFLAIM